MKRGGMISTDEHVSTHVSGAERERTGARERGGMRERTGAGAFAPERRAHGACRGLLGCLAGVPECTQCGST